MCFVGIQIRVVMFLWPRMKAQFHGVSSHTRRNITTRKGVSLHPDEASAYMTVLSMSSGSYSGLAMQEPVHR
jgi:hypothetical protein